MPRLVFITAYSIGITWPGYFHLHITQQVSPILIQRGAFRRNKRQWYARTS